MSDIMSDIESLPDVFFTDNIELSDIQTQMLQFFEEFHEEVTGKRANLSKADPNRIIINACAAQIFQGIQFIEKAGRMNLLKYAYGEFLDSLAAMKGIIREEPVAATVTLRFMLAEERNSAVGIPQETRVTNGGDEFFYTLEYVEIAAGDLHIDVNAQCSDEGIVGNGFLPGELSILVDSIPYIDSVENISVSSGGADRETDESLAERTVLAPAKYSTAGPDDAYVYWAKTFNQSIGDVVVYSPEPVFVDIRFIMENGTLPDSNIIDGLEEFLMNGKIRPLTDKVTVGAPEICDYNIKLSYYINRSDRKNAESIQVEVEKAINDFVSWQCTKIGRDINPSQLVKRIVEAGAKRVRLSEPRFLAISDISVAKLVDLDIQYGGLEDD